MKRYFLLEVNPRASRTVPFVSKATGLPLAKIAARVMMGKSLEGAGLLVMPEPPIFFGKRIGVSVYQVSRRRSDSRPGNEIDRRSYGHRPDVCHCVRQGPAGLGHQAAGIQGRCLSAFVTATNLPRSSLARDAYGPWFHADCDSWHSQSDQWAGI